MTRGPTTLYASFLNGKKNPDGGEWSYEAMSPEKEEKYKLYEKQLRKARIDLIHLKHLREFKTPILRAKKGEAERSFLDRVCKTGVRQQEESSDMMRREEEEMMNKRKNNRNERTCLEPAMKDSWDGSWRNGAMYGNGTKTYPDGGSATGRFRNNRLNCSIGAVATFADGAVYQGGFRNGLFDGKGTCIYPSGSKYEGFWSKGLRNGRGKMEFPSGQIYEGIFRRGDFHGLGKLVSATGHRFEGLFAGGLIKGHGTLTLKTTTGNGEEAPRKFVREWAKGNLRDAVNTVREEIRLKKLGAKMEMDDLLGHVRKIRLSQYIEAVREQIKFDREEEKRIGNEAKRKGDVERRTKTIEAKQAMLVDLESGKDGGDSDSDDDETDSSEDEDVVVAVGGG